MCITRIIPPALASIHHEIDRIKASMEILHSVLKPAKNFFLEILEIIFDQ